MSINASKAPKLPDGVAQILLRDGVVMAYGAPKLANGQLSILVGTERVRLQSMKPEDIRMTELSLEYRPNFGGKIRLKDGADPSRLRGQCELMLNQLSDWAMPGRDTIQIRITKHDQGLELPLASPIQLPPHEMPLLFRANLAVHRGSGRLIGQRVKAGEMPDPTQATIFSFAFDENYLGGQSVESYAESEQVLRPADYPTDIYLTVAFDSYMSDGSDMPPFFFVGDPHVGAREGNKIARTGILLEGDKEPKPNYIWQQADLPRFVSKDETLALLKGASTYPLIQGSSQTIHLIEDHGHSMLFSASEPGTFSFFVDGAFAFEQSLASDPSWVTVPSQFLTGHYRNLTVLDCSGTQKLFSTYALLPRLSTPLVVMQKESRRPFPGPLMPQAEHRYEALRDHMAAGMSLDEQAQISYVLGVVEGGYENVKLKPLSFKELEAPDVSIIIPAHNKVEVTYLALASLLLAHNEASFEVILVDDASTDETAELEQLVSGIKVIHNAQSQKFIRACNLGATEARGRYVALLNNDVEVTNGWLDALIDAFHRFEGVGLAGSKLLYPDGKLQDAGGIIWGSGNPWNYGNRQNPWEPRFCYARQADYLSGAAMLTSRTIWEEVGGLSSYLEPMYFEDTDFAFKVREAGYTTWFVPSSVVYHFEGMTSGTDTSKGFKKYQEVNRPKFKRRWAAEYSKFGTEGINADLEKDRGIIGRVLFVDAMIPRPDRDAGSYASIQEIKLVQSLGYKVTFLASNMAHLGSYTDELQRMGVEVIYSPFYLSMDDYLDKHARDFNACYITRYYVAREIIGKLRSLVPDMRILFNNADLHFLRELRAGIATGDSKKIASAHETRAMELEIMCMSDVVLSYSETEHAVIQSHTDGDVQIAKCPWVVDVPDTVVPLEGRRGLSFLGNYQHAPNAEGVLWISRDVMPLLESVQPGLTLSIYGAGMTDEIKTLKSQVIDPVGFVTNLEDAYDKHRIFVAPLLSGAGIKGKVLTALAQGVPCVLTPTAAEGIGLRHRHDCMIATTPAEWRDAIVQLNEDDDLWQKLSGNARDYVRQSFSFEAGRALMREAFERVELFSPIT